MKGFDLTARTIQKLDTPASRDFMAALAIACGVLLPFLLVPYEDFRYGDEAYQAYCCEHYEKAYLGMLSFWVGNLWMKLFGHTFIALRCLMTLCYVLTAAIGCVYVKRRGFSTLQTSLVFFLSSLGLVLSYLPLYGWDAGAYPFTAAGLLAVLLYIDSPNCKYAAFMGLTAGLMTLSRLPLAIIAPIMAVIIVAKPHFQNGRQLIWKELAYFAVPYACVVLLLTTAMAGSPANYLRAFQTDNTVAAHSFSDYDWIIDRCIRHAYDLYPWLLPGCVAVLLSICYAKSRRYTIWLGALTAAILYYTVKGVYFNANPGRSLFWQNHGVIVPEAFIAILFAPLYAVFTNKEVKYKRLSVAALILFGLLQAFGSNSATERVGWGLAMVFAFGVSSDAFLKARRFTIFFLLFSSATTALVFSIKVRGLSRLWTSTVNVNYATAFNGTKIYGNEFSAVEAIDSVKFIKEHAETQGFRTFAIGTESNCYNFPFGENGENSGIKFDVYSEDVINDYRKLNANMSADMVFELSVKPDPALRKEIEADGYTTYFQTRYPAITIYAKKDALTRLPGNPFREWGYEGPGE